MRTRRSADARCANGGICCCRRCRRCRRASAGSARARSTTSARGSTFRPPTRGASRRSTRCCRRRRVRARVLHVCDDIACRCKGAEELIARARGAVGPAGRRRAGAHVAAHPVSRLVRSRAGAHADRGRRAPVEHALGAVTVEDAVGALRAETVPARSAAGVPQQGEPGASPARRVGAVDPTSLDAYRARGGYRGAAAGASRSGRGRVIRELKTRTSWGAAARRSRPAEVGGGRRAARASALSHLQRRRVRARHVQGPRAARRRPVRDRRGDDDRRVRDRLRARLPLHSRRVPARRASDRQHAIEVARLHGFLGDEILGAGFQFDIEIRRGAGAYICGEETAIFNSIEGYRGEPRNKPPFPVERGLFGLPTVVNNVETLVNVLVVLRNGGAEFAQIGTEQSTGTKLFCLCGARRRPGVYEVPFGETLRELIELAGGVPDGHTLQAVLLGGAAGGVRRSRSSSTCRSRSRARARPRRRSAPGVMVAFDETVDMRDILLRIAAFFRDESCGQCVPCRVGTVRQEEALRADRRRARPAARSPRRSRCSTKSERACGTRRSAGSARRRTARSSRRSTSWACSKEERWPDPDRRAERTVTIDDRRHRR